MSTVFITIILGKSPITAEDWMLTLMLRFHSYNPIVRRQGLRGPLEKQQGETDVGIRGTIDETSLHVGFSAAYHHIKAFGYRQVE
jgi:hypothetical protein